MGIKIKFLKPVSQNKFLHNLVNAKKRNSNYKHLYHKLLEEAQDKFSFQIYDENKNIVYCDIDFYPQDNEVCIECQPCDFEMLQSLLVFDLLESINEKSIIRFIDFKYFFDGGMDFYLVQGGLKNKIYKISSDRMNTLDVTNSRILAEIDGLDFI
ncbi:MAG: hypothetical protein PHQ20_00025 [Candidatus Moranbacteria bacterium]|nr:hypothetical protein [Candidatus Moranbacteria bacterium]